MPKQLGDMENYCYFCKSKWKKVAVMTNRIITTTRFEDALARRREISDLILMVRCLSGKMQIEMNGERLLVEPGDLLMCHPTFILGDYMRTPDFECHIWGTSIDSLKDITHRYYIEDSRWWDKAQYLMTHPVLHLDKRQVELCEEFGRLNYIYRSYELTPERENILRAFLQIGLCEIMSWIGDIISTQQQPKVTHKDYIFRKFLELLQQTKGTQHEVQWFAKQLSITPKYLTAACKAAGGVSASRMIDDVVIQEIRRMLKTTDFTAKEICVRLNFSNISFFCKYVKQHLGVSATKFRKQSRR